MSSALTTAALAVTGCQGYFPMEDTSGVVAVDAGPFGITSLAQGGAGGHIARGGPARVPGSLGSWTGDGTAGEFLQRAVPGGDKFKFTASQPFTLLGWIYPTASPSAANLYDVFGLDPQFGIGYIYAPSVSAWSSSQPYILGDLAFSGGFTWVALQASTNVTPVTGAYWELSGRAPSYINLVTRGNVNQTTVNPVPVGKPSMLTVTWDGYRLSTWLNSVCEKEEFTQTSAGAWDTVTITTNPFVVFGTGGGTLSLTGNIWGVGVWNIAMDAGSQRSIYLAGIGAGNEIVSAPFINTVRDAATPAIVATGPITYYCAGCAGGMRAAEGYVTFGGLKYHHGCYTASRTGITPSALANASTISDMADRAARRLFRHLHTVTRRDHVEKSVYYDALSGQPLLDPTRELDDWKRFVQVGHSAAILARYSRASRESWLVSLGAQMMEFLISCQMGIPPAWLAPGRTSIAEKVTGGSNQSAVGALTYGCLQPALDPGQSTSHAWGLQTMCLIYLSLRRQMPAATLVRWEQAIVAAAVYLTSGAYPLSPTDPVPPNTGPNSTNQYYYVNGNFMVRYAQILAMVSTITGDAFWTNQFNVALNWALYPYGTPLHWQGNWAALNTYAINNIAGPDAVRNAGNAYKCILPISGAGGNSAPAVDATHWTLIGTGNLANQQGFGLILDRQGSDSTYWTDYTAHLNEYSAGVGGGAPGTPLAGQPGYDGGYNLVQVDDMALGYFVSGDVRFRQLANALMNTAGLYPNGGGVGNPQATPFASFGGVFATPGVFGGSGSLWQIDMTSGQSGGYSTRHSLVDNFREPWLPISQLKGWRPDVTTGYGIASFITSVENQVQLWVQNRDTIDSIGYYIQYLMAAPSWPGF